MEKIFLLKKTFHVVTLNSSYMHHSTLWKSWNTYAVWTPQVKENQNYLYWHKYLHLHLYKVKKADNPVPPVQHTQLLANTHFPMWLPPSDTEMGTQEYGAKKFQTALSDSKQRNWK